jgi:hypothetical protein
VFFTYIYSRRRRPTLNSIAQLSQEQKGNSPGIFPASSPYITSSFSVTYPTDGQAGHHFAGERLPTYSLFCEPLFPTTIASRFCWLFAMP